MYRDICSMIKQNCVMSYCAKEHGGFIATRCFSAFILSSWWWGVYLFILFFFRFKPASNLLLAFSFVFVWLPEFKCLTNTRPFGLKFILNVILLSLLFFATTFQLSIMVLTFYLEQKRRIYLNNFIYVIAKGEGRWFSFLCRHC